MNQKSSISLTIGPTRFLMLCAFAACMTFFCEMTRAESSKIVATVDETAITSRDISYRMDIEKAYGNEGIALEAALVSLINDLIEHEVAKNYGVLVSQEEIDSFKKHVDENTKDPEILQRVKLIFDGDLPSYERIYLSPKIINRKLRYFYHTTPDLHKPERALIERVYSLAASKKPFQEAAQGLGLISFRFETVQENLFKNPLIPILKTLKTGEMYKNIVEDDFSYRVMRLWGKNNGKYLVEAITVAKRLFDDWLGEQTARIKIEFLDNRIRSSILEKYPDFAKFREKPSGTSLGVEGQRH